MRNADAGRPTRNYWVASQAKTSHATNPCNRYIRKSLPFSHHRQTKPRRFTFCGRLARATGKYSVTQTAQFTQSPMHPTRTVKKRAATGLSERDTAEPQKCKRCKNRDAGSKGSQKEKKPPPEARIAPATAFENLLKHLCARSVLAGYGQQSARWPRRLAARLFAFTSYRPHARGCRCLHKGDCRRGGRDSRVVGDSPGFVHRLRPRPRPGAAAGPAQPRAASRAS